MLCIKIKKEIKDRDKSWPKLTGKNDFWSGIELMKRMSGVCEVDAQSVDFQTSEVKPQEVD